MDETTQRELRERLDRALDTVGAIQPGRDTVFAELVTRHGEAHRHYHTLEHVEACLRWLDWYAGLAERPAEIALALFFHDAVYDPRAGDNEVKSAALARERLGRLAIPADAIERIASAIEATEHHDATHGDARLMVDLDLTILGAKPAVFDDFEGRIRKEYAHVPAALFGPGRRAVLERLAAHRPIYRTKALADQLETRARANLERRIAELEIAATS
jgi:predicted metal-dependent HD superfamily phosphohydrolase